MSKVNPYYAVIFTSARTADDHGYAEMSQKMEALAQEQAGFLGMESARDEIGITVSYWESLEAIANWKANTDHLFAQRKGKTDWYKWYKVRICLVEREYDFELFRKSDGNRKQKE
ncbi:MAG: antibiotic biosynthesis monooxygenase [Pricia sp.]